MPPMLAATKQHTILLSTPAPAEEQEPEDGVLT